METLFIFLRLWLEFVFENDVHQIRYGPRALGTKIGLKGQCVKVPPSILYLTWAEDRYTEKMMMGYGRINIRMTLTTAVIPGVFFLCM